MRVTIAIALIGTWTLRSFTDISGDGPPRNPFGLRPEGLLIYTPDGFVSALLMTPGRPPLGGAGSTDGTPDQFKEAGSGFIGYSGRYEVDEMKSIVRHTPLVAFSSDMVGKSQQRLVELNGDVLILTAEHAQPVSPVVAKSQLEWVRVKDIRPEGN